MLINIVFMENVILNIVKDDVFIIYDDVSGIIFENNILSFNIEEFVFQGCLIGGMFKQEIVVDVGRISIMLDNGIIVGFDFD